MVDTFSGFFLLLTFVLALVARVQIDGYLIELRVSCPVEWERLGRPIDVPWGERFFPLFMSCCQSAIGLTDVSSAARSKAFRTVLSFSLSMLSGITSALPWIDK